jgi:hypothetical protein
MNEYGTLTYFVALNIVKIERIDFNYIISDKWRGTLFTAALSSARSF